MSHGGSASCPGSCVGRCQLECGTVISAPIGLPFPKILGGGWLGSVAGEMFSPQVVGHIDCLVHFT